MDSDGTEIAPETILISDSFPIIAFDIKIDVGIITGDDNRIDKDKISDEDEVTKNDPNRLEQRFSHGRF